MSSSGTMRGISVKQPETLFKEKVLRLLAQVPRCHVIKIQQVCKVGDPDIIMCVAGRFVAWELKVGKNRATKLQQYILDQIRASGGIAEVVTPDSLDQHLAALNRPTTAQ